MAAHRGQRLDGGGHRPTAVPQPLHPSPVRVQPRAIERAATRAHCGDRDGAGHQVGLDHMVYGLADRPALGPASEIEIVLRQAFECDLDAARQLKPLAEGLDRRTLVAHWTASKSPSFRLSRTISSAVLRLWPSQIEFAARICNAGILLKSSPGSPNSSGSISRVGLASRTWPTSGVIPWPR